MAAAFSFTLALRYLLSRWINLIGICGVAVAVWALIVVIAVFSGFIADIRSNLHQVSPDLLVTDLPEDQSYEYGSRLKATVLADPDVVAAAPRAEHYGIYFLTDIGMQPDPEPVAGRQGIQRNPPAWQTRIHIRPGEDPKRQPAGRPLFE